jgi:phage shock protein C
MARTRKLYRSRADRKLAGVCGGLAQYLNTDLTLIRVLFVVLALLGGPASWSTSSCGSSSQGAARRGVTRGDPSSGRLSG